MAHRQLVDKSLLIDGVSNTASVKYYTCRRSTSRLTIGGGHHAIVAVRGASYTAGHITSFHAFIVRLYGIGFFSQRCLFYAFPAASVFA